MIELIQKEVLFIQIYYFSLSAGVSTRVAVVDAVTSQLLIRQLSSTILTRPTVMTPLPH